MSDEKDGKCSCDVEVGHFCGLCRYEEALDKIKSLESRLASSEELNRTFMASEKADMERINALESRLKEANDEIVRIKDSTMPWTRGFGDGHKSRDKEIQSLEQRLSQAEKELERLYEFERSVTPQIKAINEERFQEVFKLKERLSHLMDVGGKMARAIKDIVTQGECLPPSFDDETMSHWVEIGLGELERAKLALAEWDGIKESK